MAGLVHEGIDEWGECVSLRLQGASAPALDLVGAVDDVSDAQWTYSRRSAAAHVEVVSCVSAAGRCVE
jgi:hypothetical protein